MSRQRDRPRPSSWQKSAQAELRALRAEFANDLAVRLPGRIDQGMLIVEITLDTSSLRPPAPGGLALGESETFIIAIPEHNLIPPHVLTPHTRFLEFPHVLAGQAICLYLDPAREWQPAHGMRGLINRLWTWLDDAVNARFDPSTALYHAVGGVLHSTPGAPTIVIRHPIDVSIRAATGHLVARTGHRYDHHPRNPVRQHDIPMPVFVLPRNLPFGAGRDRLVDLLRRLDHADSQPLPLGLAESHRDERRDCSSPVPSAATSPCSEREFRLTDIASRPGPHVGPEPPTTATALLTVLAASAARQPDGSPQYLLLGVPHPTGGAPHLLGLRLSADVGDALRRAVRTRNTTIMTLSSSDVPSDIEMEWCPVSDERREVTIRRDINRPVSVFEGKTVHVWGCGGLGSWTAEFTVRAGAQKVVICDPSTVTGGLLVRQNFTEHDVGGPKANSLAERLRAISDITEIEVHTGILPADCQDAAATADLIIDATISLAIAQVMQVIAADPRRRAALAQIATDSRTGTLGLAVVATPGSGGTSLQQIDVATGTTVAGNSELEGFRAFWEEPVRSPARTTNSSRRAVAPRPRSTARRPTWPQSPARYSPSSASASKPTQVGHIWSRSHTPASPRAIGSCRVSRQTPHRQPPDDVRPHRFMGGGQHVDANCRAVDRAAATGSRAVRPAPQVPPCDRPPAPLTRADDNRGLDPQTQRSSHTAAR